MTRFVTLFLALLAPYFPQGPAIPGPGSGGTSAAITFVESKGATTNGSTSAISIALSNTTVSGEDIGVSVYTRENSANGCATGESTVTDSASQTYTFIWGTFTSGTSGGGCIELWQKHNSAS